MNRPCRKACRHDTSKVWTRAWSNRCAVKRPFEFKIYANAQVSSKEFLTGELLKTKNLTLWQNGDATLAESLGCRAEGLLLHCAPCATPGFSTQSR